MGGCSSCCRNRGKVHGYVGPPSQQPVTVTAIITHPAPTCPPPTVHYPNYPTAGYTTTTPQPPREVPPPYTETASAPGQSYHVHDYTQHQQSAYNPKY